MVFGGPGLVREMSDLRPRGRRPDARKVSRANPDTLVVGVDFALTHLRLTSAVNAVLRGAWFVATNRDPIYPIEDGLLAGAGSIVAAVSWSAGREPDLVVGKPEPTLFIEAAASVGIPAQDAVVIGDGLVTDISAANRGRGTLGADAHRCDDAEQAVDARSRRCARPRWRAMRASSNACSSDSRPSRTLGRLQRGLGAQRRRRTRPGVARAVGSSSWRNATSRAWRSIAHSSGSVMPTSSHDVAVLAHQRQVADGAVVRRERHGHAGAEQRCAIGCSATDGTMSGLDVAGRAEVQGDARARSARPSDAGSSIAPGPWAMRDGFELQRAPDLRRATPLAGMAGDAEAAGARHVERGARGAADPGKRSSWPAQSKPVSPSPTKRTASSAISRFRSGGCERSATAMSRISTPVAAAPRPRARDHRRDPVPQREPALRVQRRRPADLGVARPVRRHVLDQLVRDALQRLGVLHQRDRQVEGAQQLELALAADRSDQAVAHRSRFMPSSRPRWRASSSAVSGRSDPSRWRCSSALGIRAMSASTGSATVDRPPARRRDRLRQQSRPAS